MSYKKLISLSLFILLVAPMNFAYWQDDENTEEERVAELKANVKELLRETSSMALTLGSSTNRVGFTIKSADILWDLDETDARSMFNASTEDIKRLMGQIDVETNQLRESRNRSWNRGSSSARNKLRTKSSQVISMRSSLVTSLASHDPEWAMRFLRETNSIFTSPSLIKRIERSDKRLESRVIRKIANKDVTAALGLAREKLSKGISSDVISLTNSIYAKDKEKGADFAEDVLQKLNSSTLKNNQTWLVVQFFQNGLRTANAVDSPLLDSSSMTNLAELLASMITNSSNRYRSLSSTVIKGLEKHSPNSASQVRRTFEQRKTSRAGRNGSNSRAIYESVRKKDRGLWEERIKFQNEITTDIQNLSDESLTQKERQKIIDDAKNKILSVNDDRFRFDSLIGLAVRISVAGDKKTAANVLNEAESFIKQDPKERMDFSNNQSLADAYALVDPDKSFVILENMIYRLNGVINGYIQYMQFSGNGRIVENDELIINSRSRQFTNYFKFSPQSIRNLAEKDYVRLKDLADRFERSEVRVEIRLLIANALMQASQPVEDSNKFKNTKAVAK